MPLSKEQIKWLEGLGEECVHARNMLAKKKHPQITKFYTPYKDFRKGLNGSLKAAVKALNKYKGFVKKNKCFTAQSKFVPTILEEFLCETLKKEIRKKEFGKGVLRCGGIKAYSSLYFTRKDGFEFELKSNVKDQDVCLYKEESLNFGGKNISVRIPIVCIECKRYLDKTMYEGCVATAMKIKTGNPLCKFYIATETYGVESSVDIETTLIDNIYVLRKQKHPKKQKSTGEKSLNDIDAGVIRDLLREIRKTLKTKRQSVDAMIAKGHLRQ